MWVDYWGAKGYVGPHPPPLKLLGGGWPPLPPSLPTPMIHVSTRRNLYRPRPKETIVLFNYQFIHESGSSRYCQNEGTVELQWLEQTWNHEN